MERETRNRKGAVALATVFVLALCLSFVAPAAATHLPEYEAPLAGPQGYLEFKVKSKRSQRTHKFRPVALKKFALGSVPFDCGEGVEVPVSGRYPDQIPVSRRRISFTGDMGKFIGGADSPFTIKGRVPRAGRPKGTFHGSYVDDRYGLCETGLLTWTARRLPPGTL